MKRSIEPIAWSASDRVDGSDCFSLAQLLRLPTGCFERRMCFPLLLSVPSGPWALERVSEGLWVFQQFLEGVRLEEGGRICASSFVRAPRISLYFNTQNQFLWLIHCENKARNIPGALPASLVCKYRCCSCRIQSITFIWTLKSIYQKI